MCVHALRYVCQPIPVPLDPSVLQVDPAKYDGGVRAEERARRNRSHRRARQQGGLRGMRARAAAAARRRGPQPNSQVVLQSAVVHIGTLAPESSLPGAGATKTSPRAPAAAGAATDTDTDPPLVVVENAMFRAFVSIVERMPCTWWLSAVPCIVAQGAMLTVLSSVRVSFVVAATPSGFRLSHRTRYTTVFRIRSESRFFQASGPTRTVVYARTLDPGE